MKILSKIQILQVSVGVFFNFVRDYLVTKLLDSAIDKISDSLSKEHLKQ